MFDAERLLVSASKVASVSRVGSDNAVDNDNPVDSPERRVFAEQRQTHCGLEIGWGFMIRRGSLSLGSC